MNNQGVVVVFTTLHFVQLTLESTVEECIGCDVILMSQGFLLAVFYLTLEYLGMATFFFFVHGTSILFYVLGD